MLHRPALCCFSLCTGVWVVVKVALARINQSTQKNSLDGLTCVRAHFIPEKLCSSDIFDYDK